MLPPFSPSPSLASCVLDACTDPALTLRDIALANNTTVEALSLWLATSEMSERFNHLHSVNAVRVRYLAAANLSTALIGLAKTVRHASALLADLKAVPQTPQTSILAPANSPPPAALAPAPTTPPAPTSDPQDHSANLRPIIAQIRLLEISRRAATTIVALTRWSPTSAARGSSPCSSPTPQQHLSPAQPPLQTPHTDSHPSPPPTSAHPQPSAPQASTHIPLPSLPRIPTFAPAEAAAPLPPLPDPIAPLLDSEPTPPAPSQDAPATPTPDSPNPIIELLAALTALPIPVPTPPPDRVPLTPEQAAYRPAPGQPSLGELETLSDYLALIESSSTLASAFTAQLSQLQTTTTHEHWP